MGHAMTDHLMNRAAHDVMLRFHEREVRRLTAQKPSCLTCHHYSDHRASCDKFNAVPPVEFRSNGCEHWVLDEIPF